MLSRKLFLAALAAVTVSLVGADTALAIEKVKIGAMHMCCPICEKTIYDTLKKVKGVTDAKVLRSGNSLTFTAGSRATAEEAVGALLKQGYWGDIKINSEAYVPAYEKIEPGQKFDEVVFDTVHICLRREHWQHGRDRPAQGSGGRAQRVQPHRQDDHLQGQGHGPGRVAAVDAQRRLPRGVQQDEEQGFGVS